MWTPTGAGSVLLFISMAAAALSLPKSTLSSPRQSNTAVNVDESCVANALALNNFVVRNGRVQMGSTVKNQNTTVAFQVDNPATGLRANCSAYGPALTVNGLGGNPFQWYDCSFEPNNLNMTASFQFNGVISDLTLRETWLCIDDSNHTYVLLLGVMGPCKKRQLMQLYIRTRVQASMQDTLPVTCTEPAAKDNFAYLCIQDGEARYNTSITLTKL